MEENRVYHLDNRIGLPQLPEKCCQLLIADPPYYKVKGDFDFVWKSFDEYLEFMEGQAKMYKRILATNGTLFLYGDDKRIAYLQVIFDKYFTLVNNLVWKKMVLYGQTGNETIRSFPPCTERILMYSLEKENIIASVYYIRDYIREEIQKSKGTIILKDINSILGTATNGGGVASACLSLEKTEPAMITEEMYLKLQNWCYPFMNKPYKELRGEYDELRRPFENRYQLSEVLEFDTETPNFTTGKLDHPTVKPEKLTRALILTCSRPNDLVVIPFAGSGTECAMAAKEGRRFIAFETTEKHVTMSNKRAQKELSQPNLFNRA